VVWLLRLHYKTNSLTISLIIRLELVVRTIGLVVRTIGLIVRTIRLTVRIPAFRGTREADNSTISLQPDTSRGIVLVVRSALSWPPRGQVPCYGTWRKSLDLLALPVLPVVQPPDPSVACWSPRYHQPQHRLLPTPFCRVEPLDQVPLERLDAGLGDGVAPTKRSWRRWRRHCLADVFAHDAVVLLRALRGLLSIKSKLRWRGCRLRSLRSPRRSLPLRWLVALRPGSSKRRCNSRQRSRLRGSVAGSTGYGLHPTPRPIGQPTLPLSLPGTKAKAKSFEHKQVLEV